MSLIEVESKKKWDEINTLFLKEKFDAYAKQKAVVMDESSWLGTGSSTIG